MTFVDVKYEEERLLYPQAMLYGCTDALVLFAAGFHGRQDAVWIADAGLTATCVDTDGAKLGWMEARYPEGWEFIHASVFAWAPSMDGVRAWDLVSLDPPTHLFSACAALMPLWGRLARRGIVLGSNRTVPSAPPGWAQAGLLRRSDFRGGVYWASYLKEPE